MHVPELIAAARDGLHDPGANATLEPQMQAALTHSAELAWPYLLVGLGVAFVWSIAWIGIVQAFAESLIYIALIATPAVFLALTLWPGNPSPVATGVFFIVTMFYACWIVLTQRNRVEFARLTPVATVAGVIRTHPGMWIVSLLSMVPAVAWQLAWLMTAGATFFHFRAHGERFSYVDSRTGESREGVSIGALGVITLVFLLLSTYWTSQVISNVVHVTNSGVLATWYFRQRSRLPRPTVHALGRALSTSFGSICLGSLLVALVQLLHDMAESARQNSAEGGLVSSIVWCCVVCFIGYLEALIALFNHWAFTQVAIYGKDFKTAARHTWHLVEARGLSGLVNMNLTSNAVGLGVLLGGVLSAALVAGLAHDRLLVAPTSKPGVSEDVQGVYAAAYALTIAAAAVCAVACTTTISSAVTSGVTTLFVCWAEDPAALLASNPPLHASFEHISSGFLRDHPPRHGPGPDGRADVENPRPLPAQQYQAPTVAVGTPVGQQPPPPNVPVAHAVPASQAGP